MGIRRPSSGPAITLPCEECKDGTRHWDRVDQHVLCPNCIESLVTNEAEKHIRFVVEQNRCLICHELGTVHYETFPLRQSIPIQIDLCSEHIRALLARRLGPHAFEQIRRHLEGAKLLPAEIFLLHEAFYDSRGHALQPAEDPW